MIPRIVSASVVAEPGLFRMEEAGYHSDPCPEASLSRSIAELLLLKSARHAWTAHPRLNPDWLPDHAGNERRVDIGQAAHARLLGQPVEIVEIGAEAYQTKAAKEARKAAYESGAIPLLEPDARLVDGMMERAAATLCENDTPAVRAIADPATGRDLSFNEVVLAWRDRVGGRWARARLDRLTFGQAAVTIVDYKTTERSAAPAEVHRAIFGNVYHLQDGFYRRGLRQLVPEIDRHELKLDFVFIVQEQDPPFEITVARISPAGRVIGEKMASAAFRMWDRAVATNQWPGYPATTTEADMPAWVETHWLAREIEDPRFDGLPIDPLPMFEASPYRPKELVGPC